MKPSSALFLFTGLAATVSAASPDQPAQEGLRYIQKAGEPGHVAPAVPQRASPPADDDGLRVPMMKAEAGKGARDAKMVILGVVGAAGLFAFGLV